MEVLKTQRLRILKLILILQIALLVFTFFRVTNEGHYFLVHDDEVINYCSARVFSETSSLRAESCIAEEVSRIGQMNWYGPGYQVIYGIFQRIFGDHTTLFIQLHFAFAVMALVLIFMLPVTAEDKLLSSVALIFTEQFSAYIFTYFPEALHIFLGIGLTWILLLIHQTNDQRKSNRYVFLYIGIVMIAVLCRVTTIFWLTGLVGLSTSRRRSFVMISVFVAGIVITLLYMRYFNAPPYAADMKKIDALFSFDLVDFVIRTLRATARNTIQLIISGSVSVYLLITLIALAAIRWWITRNALLLASLLVSLSLIGAMMAYYSASPWYFLKQSASLVPLLIIALLITTVSARLKYAIVALTLITMPVTWKNTEQSILQRKAAYGRLQENPEFRSALHELKDFITETRDITVLWYYVDFDFGATTESLLPFSTRTGHPILYTTNIIAPGEGSDQKFQRHHKLRIDYILSRESLNLSYVQLVHATKYYYFYKIIED